MPNENTRIILIPCGFFHPSAARNAPVKGKMKQSTKTARQWHIFLTNEYTRGVLEELIGLV
jgi:hypothetical protein